MSMDAMRALAAALVMMAGVASAEPAIDSLEPATFQARRQAIETELAKGKRYYEISKGDQAEVLSGLEKIGQWLAQGGGADNAEVQASMQRVNELLAQAEEDSRVVCQRRKVVGSNRPAKVCKSVAVMRAEREKAEREMIELQRPLTEDQMTGSGGRL